MGISFKLKDELVN